MLVLAMQFSRDARPTGRQPSAPGAGGGAENEPASRAGSGHSLKTEQRIRQAALGELREVETYDRSPREGSQLARDQPRSVPSVGRRAVNSLERR